MSCVNCYNYSTWKFLAWWLSYRCNPAMNYCKLCKVNEMWSERSNCSVCVGLTLCWCFLCAFVGLDNKLYKIHGTYSKIITLAFSKRNWRRMEAFHKDRHSAANVLRLNPPPAPPPHTHTHTHEGVVSYTRKRCFKLTNRFQVSCKVRAMTH